MNIQQELSRALRGEVRGDKKTREAKSRDASLFTLLPRLVVQPKDAKDVGALVRAINRLRAQVPSLSVTARSAGTDMSGGPLTTSLVVDMLPHFTRIGSVKNNTITVQPGVYYRDFEPVTLAEHLLLPSYPASRELCTVGGMVANNSGGEKSLTYGKTDRYVKELRAVLRDGKEYTFRALSKKELAAKKELQTVEGDIYRRMDRLVRTNARVLANARPRVSKNSSGYALWDVYNKEADTFDLTKVLVGSQGTLGIITDITFSLVQPKPASSLLVLFLNDLHHLAEIVNHVLKYKPESFESYDNNTLRVALRFLPDLLKQMKGSLFTLLPQFLPEARMLLVQGLPQLILLAEFTGETHKEALLHAEHAQANLASFGIRTRVTKTPEETHKYWVIRRESFNLLRHHTHGMRTAPFIDDFVVRPETFPVFLPKLYTILQKHPLIFTIAGHVGDGNFHIIPLMDMKKPESRKIIEELSREVYALVLQHGGSITGEHNDGLIRSSFLRDEFGPSVYGLFEKTKEIFDPENIFNPGKKVHANLRDAFTHIDTNS